MKKANFKIGMTAAEVLAEIAKTSPNIRSLSFYPYFSSKNTRERKTKAFSQLLFHDYSKPAIRLARKEISAERISAIIDGLSENQVLGAMSLVDASYTGKYHIPMMDFICPPCEKNLARLKSFLERVGSGVILDSGRSYHYYGFQVMGEKCWLDFLGDCLLSNLTDSRYIGHRLKDRCGILRISASPLRPEIPKVVAIL